MRSISRVKKQKGGVITAAVESVLLDHQEEDCVCISGGVSSPLGSGERRRKKELKRFTGPDSLSSRGELRMCNELLQRLSLRFFCVVYACVCIYILNRGRDGGARTQKKNCASSTTLFALHESLFFFFFSHTSPILSLFSSRM